MRAHVSAKIEPLRLEYTSGVRYILSDPAALRAIPVGCHIDGRTGVTASVGASQERAPGITAARSHRCCFWIDDHTLSIYRLDETTLDHTPGTGDRICHRAECFTD